MNKNYSNVDIKKFEDLQQQNAAGHNLRQIPSENVDPKKSHLNKFYIGSPNMNFLQERMAKLSKFKIRKNAVLSVNLVFSASHEFFNDKKKSELWEKQTFDFIVKEFGIENIVYAVVHHDEFTPHFQVSVVPVDPQGKLNASYFFDGRKKCNEFTTRYNQAVKNLGLLRDKGIKKAKPQDTRDYYEKVQKSVEFDGKLENQIKQADEGLFSYFPFIKVSTAKKIIQPFLSMLKSYEARFIDDKKKIKDAEKLKLENEDLKAKFEELGLSHEMKYLELQKVKNLIDEGRSARAEMEAAASKVVQKKEAVSPPLSEKSKNINLR